MMNFDETLNSLLAESYFKESKAAQVDSVENATVNRIYSSLDPDVVDCPKAKKFIDNVIKLNQTKPHKPGAMISSASTDRNSDIYNDFVKKFGKTKMTLLPGEDEEHVFHQTSYEPSPVVMWVAPDRTASSAISYTEDCMHIIAKFYLFGHPLYGGELQDISSRRLPNHKSPGSYYYELTTSDGQKVHIPTTVTVGDLLGTGQVHVEVYFKQVSQVNPEPFVVFRSRDEDPTA